jgi:hypothetical protein
MADQNTRDAAERRFAEALRTTGARDPRDFYRERLRELRSSDQRAFQRAMDHFEQQLLPAVAREDSNPIEEWLEYGCLLADLLEPGSAVCIDPTGRSRPHGRPVALEDLVLHLPTSGKGKALAVGLPPELSPAQRATYALLVGAGLESLQE